MANDIVIIREAGGLGRTSANLDNVSGLIFYNGLPTGFSTDSIQKVFSIEDAQNLGITETLYPVEHYQVSEFFRLNSTATLYISCNNTAVTYDYQEVEDLAIFANGDVRQVGIYNTNVSASTTAVGSIQTKVDDVDENHRPLSVIAGFDISGVTLTSLPDMRALTANKVSVIIGQGSIGQSKSTSTSVPAVGTLLGAISSAKVSESIAWINRFDIKDESNNEFDEPQLGEGTLQKNVSPGLENQLTSYGYIFIKKHIGLTGSYFNESSTSIAATSDFAYIENNRTIDKAARNIRTALLPYLNGPLKIDAETGQVASITIKELEGVAKNSLTPLENNDEISGFDVYIDPTQNVLSTSKIVVVVKIVPIGVAREIEVKLSFTTKL